MSGPFLVRMAARELRASWRRLLFFFVCVAIGVGAIVALRSIVQSVRVTLVGEARTLVGGDVAISTTRPWDPAMRRDIDSRLSHYRIAARSEAAETATMARVVDSRGGAARPVELLGVDAAFPLYGEVKVESGQYSYDLLRNRGVLVRPELQAQLDVKVGDTLLVGGQPFTVRGIVTSEPGSRPGAFSFGPRILVSLDDLRSIGLLTGLSRVRYQLLLKVPAEADASRIAQEMRAAYRGRFVGVRWFRATEEDVGEDLAKAEDYLSLVGFIIVVLGGVGVWSVTRVFLQQRLRSIAVLKCIGATSGDVMATYLLQTILLAVAGSIAGVALAAIGVAALPARVTQALGGIRVGITMGAVLQGLAVGVLVSVLFALVPLLDVRRIRPLVLLREGLAQPRRRVDAVKIVASGVLLVALGAVAVWQAGSWRIGLAVLVGLLAVAGLLLLAGMGLSRAIAPMASSRRFAVRHGVLSLRRPGNQTRVILMAVGLGTFFVLGVRLVQVSLLDTIQLQISAESPDMFLIDVQPDQLDRIRSIMRAAHSPEPKLIPVLRARVTGVRGQLVNLESYQDVRGRGSLGREYVVTYRDALESNEKLLEGTFGPRADTAPGTLPTVSVEKLMRDRFNIRVGDTMRFDVMGRVFEARVASVREVDWSRARSGGFIFVFEPRTFAGAPVSYVGFLKAPPDPRTRARLQRDVSAALPNVSIIDARELFERAQRIVDNVSLGVAVVGLVALLAGVLILAGAVAMTRFQRVYEAAIFRTLGGTTRTLAGMLALEYGLLGVLAGIIGAAGALALAWGITTKLMKIAFVFAPGTITIGILATALLVLAVGVAASLEVLRQKPLGTLRAE